MQPPITWMVRSIPAVCAVPVCLLTCNVRTGDAAKTLPTRWAGTVPGQVGAIPSILPPGDVWPGLLLYFEMPFPYSADILLLSMHDK